MRQIYRWGGRIPTLSIKAQKNFTRKTLSTIYHKGTKTLRITKCFLSYLIRGIVVNIFHHKGTKTLRITNVFRTP